MDRCRFPHAVEHHPEYTTHDPGLGLVYLLFHDSAHAKDRTFNLIAWMIVISFVCYIPVILFAPTHELVGMLMIPKTCAYLAVEFIAYNALFTGKHRKKKAKQA